MAENNLLQQFYFGCLAQIQSNDKNEGELKTTQHYYYHHYFHLTTIFPCEAGSASSALNSPPPCVLEYYLLKLVEIGWSSSN